jgi:hypothetical protein
MEEIKDKLSRPIKFSELCLILDRFKDSFENHPNLYSIEEFIYQEHLRRGLFNENQPTETYESDNNLLD